MWPRNVLYTSGHIRDSVYLNSYDINGLIWKQFHSSKTDLNQSGIDQNHLQSLKILQSNKTIDFSDRKYIIRIVRTVFPKICLLFRVRWCFTPQGIWHHKRFNWGPRSNNALPYGAHIYKMDLFHKKAICLMNTRHKSIFWLLPLPVASLSSLPLLR